MRQGLWMRWAAALALGLLPAAAVPAADMGPLLAQIKAVGREGAGNAEAARAWRELARGGPETLPAIFTAFDGADAATVNWLRPAVDVIAERALNAGQTLPADRLEAFVKDTRHNSAARRLAYEWLVRVDKTAPARLLPGMLRDPAAELRRDAVAVALDAADKLLARGDKDAATAAYRKALLGACDQDQVERLVAQLKKLGVEVDVAGHLGFVRRWLLVAPFDNSGEAGYAKVYPPEQGVDPAATYKGKKDAEGRWSDFTSSDRFGLVDLNQALGRQKGTVAYAYAAVESPAERPVQLRLGCINAVKVFLNGKQIIGCEEYHHGMSVDQYVGSATLKAGRNELLLKVCQNEQSEAWAQEWKFQLRLCDAAGAAVPFKETALRREVQR